ncbi:hypothetical protein SGLAM104S_01313 [Streptomyces glaucescens]
MTPRVTSRHSRRTRRPPTPPTSRTPPACPASRSTATASTRSSAASTSATCSPWREQRALPRSRRWPPRHCWCRTACPPTACWSGCARAAPWPWSSTSTAVGGRGDGRGHRRGGRRRGARRARAASRRRTCCPRRARDGRAAWDADGSLRLDHLARIGLTAPEGPYETLAGLVATHLTRIPAKGDVVVLDGWRIDVLDVDHHRADRLRVTAPLPDGAAPAPGPVPDGAGPAHAPASHEPSAHAERELAR